jgi:hypothetical protein
VSTRRIGWLLFALFALALPVPALGPFGGNAPALHYLALLTATAAVALVEGAAGPIPSILSLFAIQSGIALLACVVAAVLIARILTLLPARARSLAVLVLCGGLLAVALATPLYETPFARTPKSNLLGVLG